MEIAPLIHSRTLHCDFNPQFAVRADDVDFNWAMKKILLAMADVDILNGVRRLVASDGKICIAGIACNLRFFAEKYLNDIDARNYFHDERGREIKIFLGFSFKSGNDNEIPNVTYSMLWEMFKENLAPVWEHTALETVKVNYKTCSTKELTSGINFEKIGNINFAESNESNDEKLFEQCMAEGKNLCANADQVKIIESGEFEVISTSQGLINRFKSEHQKKTTTTKPGGQTRDTITPFKRPKIVESNTNHQKKFPLGMLVGAGAIILALLVFLLTK